MPIHDHGPSTDHQYHLTLRGYVGVAYSAVLSATGGAQPYTWSLASGALPTGLSLSANGTINGTPSSQGTFNFTVGVTDNASATATRPLSIAVTPAPYAIFSISGSAFYTYGAWTLSLYTNQPNTRFKMCAIHNGVQSCQPDWWAQTDAGGNWTLSGSFPPGNAGSWEEWLVFESGVTSNRIAFTVSDWANLSISPGPGFRVGDQWTLSLTTSIPNTYFSMCWKFNGADPYCSDFYGYTDANGHWALPGVFWQDAVGSWQEYVVLPTATSNTISFTVSP